MRYVRARKPSLALAASVAAVLLLACAARVEHASDEGSALGGVDRLPVEWRSGARLAVEIIALEGRSFPGGVYDTKLGQPCSFDEGEGRCLPVCGFSAAVYLDEECRTLGVENVAGGQRITRAFVDEVDGRADRFLEIGAVQRPSQVYRVVGGSCRAEPTAATATYHAARVMHPSEFVAGRVARVEVDGELALERISAEEGAVVSRAYVDRARNEACYVASYRGSSRCLPSTPAIVASDFADSSCSVPLARGAASTTPSVVRETDRCGSVTSMRKVGRRFAGSQIFRRYGDRCDAFTPPPDESYYELGAPLAAADFPGIALGPPARGTSRLGVVETRTASGRLMASWITDWTRGGSCMVHDLGDGVRRCVADVTHAVGGYFSDASCQSAVLPQSSSLCAGEHAARYAVLWENGGPLPGVYEIGAPAPGSVFHRASDGSCTPTTGGPSAFRQLRPAAADTFAEIPFRRLVCQRGGACGLACRGAGECAPGEACAAGMCTARPPPPSPTSTGTPPPAPTSTGAPPGDGRDAGAPGDGTPSPPSAPGGPEGDEGRDPGDGLTLLPWPRPATTEEGPAQETKHSAESASCSSTPGSAATGWEALTFGVAIVTGARLRRRATRRGADSSA